MGAVGLIPTFVGFIVVGPMTKKFGVTKTLKIAFVLGIIGNVIRCFKPGQLYPLHHRRSAGQLCHHPHDVPWRYAEQHGNGL